MENMQNAWSGFQNDDVKPAMSFDNLEFGLNSGVTVTNFEYSTKTGAGGSEGNPALIVEVQIGTNKVNRRYYMPTKVYFENNEIQPNHPEYNKQMNKEIGKLKGVITHWVKAMNFTEEQIQQGLAAANSFESLCKLAAAMINSVKNTNKVDLFLQYQYSIKGTADKTYLEIPGSLGYGAFVVPSQVPVGKWNKIDSVTTTDENNVTKTEVGISYKDDAGNSHKFTRGKGFLESNMAKQQSKDNTVAGISANATTTSSQAVSWG